MGTFNSTSGVTPVVDAVEVATEVGTETVLVVLRVPVAEDAPEEEVDWHWDRKGRRRKDTRRAWRVRWDNMAALQKRVTGVGLTRHLEDSASQDRT